MDHALKTLGRRARRQRRYHHTCAQGAQKHRRVVDRRLRAQGDAVTRLHALALQSGGDAVHHHIQRAVAQPLGAFGRCGVKRCGFGQGQSLWRRVSMLTDQVRDGGEIGLKGVDHGQSELKGMGFMVKHPPLFCLTSPSIELLLTI